MNSGFYFKIAKTNIKNNRKIYLPYILTTVCMVMTLYIVGFLESDPTILNLRGGNILVGLLDLGIDVIIIFAAIFLIYTNSFITKRRKREFGLMSVLGMDKKNIALVMLCENLIVNTTGIFFGIAVGILLSKFVEGFLLRMMDAEAAPLMFPIDWPNLAITVLVFVIIFFVIYLDSIRQIAFTNTIDLLKSSNTGEKEPKANFVIAIFGVITLGAGYYISQKVQDPVSALTYFFIAVILVILGTYALFVSGSVALVKLLKKNKGYYYKPNHFVAVSGMTYRMKRNGAGLASICILSTMVLVMLSTCICLYSGIETMSEVRYPMDITLSCYYTYADSEEADEFINALYQKAADEGVEITKKVEYSASMWYENITPDKTEFVHDREANSFSDVVTITIIDVADYNKYNRAGENITLAPNEAYVMTRYCDYNHDTIKLDNDLYNVKNGGSIEDKFYLINLTQTNMCSYMLVCIPESTAEFKARYLDMPMEEEVMRKSIGWNLKDRDDDFIMDFTENKLKPIWYNGNNGEDWVVDSFYADSHAEDMVYNVSNFGGLLFIAIILGLVFVAGTVLIMYYKQVTEGYEDAGRYEIMEKVGMTDREIKKSINSQVLTVFFTPLIFAGIHVTFAYNMILYMLQVFATDGSLFPIIILTCFAVFAVFYVAVYSITSKAYYKIVKSGSKASLN